MSETPPDSTFNLEHLPGIESEQVINLIREIEIPFLEKMRDAYKDKGWHICGETSAALSRILSLRLTIPLMGVKKAEDTTYIEVALGMYDPIHDPDRLNNVEEETYIRLHLGNGKVLFIDGIYELLMEQKPLSDGVIIVEEYEEDTIDQQLIQHHNIYPYEERLELLEKDPQYQPKQIPSIQQARDVIEALNDDRATFEYIVGNNEPRAPHKMTAHRIIPIIREFGKAPHWQENHKLKSEQAILYRKQFRLKRREERDAREARAKELKAARQRRTNPS